MNTSTGFTQSSGDVFVVEDDSAIADLLTEVLGDEGYHVRVAPSRQCALALFRTACPALLLLDMHVPGARWEELVTRFDEAGCSTVPIVMMTGAITHPEIETSPRITEILPKPFDLDRLVDCVARYARQKCTKGR